MQSHRITLPITSLTVEDLLSILKGKTKIDMDTVLPFFLLPGLLLIGALSLTVTIIIMVVIGMGTLYVISRPREKNRSPFFFSWTLCSIIVMYVFYQLSVLKKFQVTILENLVTLTLVMCTWYFFYKMKTIANQLTGYSKEKEYSPVITSDSYYCQLCQIEVNERFFHSIWWSCCVSKPNYLYFLAGQVFALMALLHGSHLGFTCVCYNEYFPYWYNTALPIICDEVYEQTLNYKLLFESCLYALGYAIVIFLVLLQQAFIYIPKYITFAYFLNAAYYPPHTVASLATLLCISPWLDKRLYGQISMRRLEKSISSQFSAD